MISMLKSTEFNKRIPKQKFYDNLSVTPAIKQFFTEQIKSIIWKNKIAPSTVNIAEGTSVKEIEVFEIKLNSSSLDESVLNLIDKEIPYHILFILEYEGKYQVWIGYKEESAGSTAFKVTGYYHTGWMNSDELSFEIQGLDTDSVYENFVRQIAGDKLKTEAAGESLKESVEKEQKRQMLQKQIDKLKSAMRKEKQLNKQMELNKKIKELKEKMEEI